MYRVALRVSVVVGSSQAALTTREICCLLNGVDRGYCMNVDGRGGRCVWWYRRPKRERQRVRLVKPNCKINPLRLYRVLDELVERGGLKRVELYLKDPLSVWGRDRHVLYYKREEQLHSRLKTKPLLNRLKERVT